MHLDEIVNWIDGAFGDMTPEAGATSARTLKDLMGDSEYQRYLQDQVNRQIIRDYLVNALVLGVISEGGLPAFAAQLSTEEGRATMALYMLMSSVEDAGELPAIKGDVELLKPLQPEPDPDPHPHIKLVTS